MNRVHRALSERLPSYRKWHEHPLSQSLHWALFLAVAFLAAGNTLHAINVYADEIDAAQTAPDQSSAPSSDQTTSADSSSNTTSSPTDQTVQTNQTVDQSAQQNQNNATSSPSASSDDMGSSTPPVVSTSTDRSMNSDSATSTATETAASGSLSTSTLPISSSTTPGLSVSSTTPSDNHPDVSTQDIASTSDPVDSASTTPVIDPSELQNLVAKLLALINHAVKSNPLNGESGQKPIMYPLGLVNDSSVVVSSVPKGIVCGEICSKLFSVNTEVVLNIDPASAPADATISWEGCSFVTGSSCRVQINGPRTVRLIVEK